MGRRGAPGAKSEQGLKGGRGLPVPTVSEDELVLIRVELPTADTVIRADGDYLP